MTLTMAMPSKGRLKENALKILSGAGYTIQFPEKGRSYQGVVANCPEMEVIFLSALEIVRELACGNAHLGITGEDLVRENINGIEEHIEFVLPLQFGHADVIVAVPEAWMDVETMADLDDVAAGFRSRYGRRLRVATKYWNLTQEFFSSHGIAVYRIVESLGATEGAPGAGSADAIVDITSTGATLRANHLKILKDGIILKSQACLVASKTAEWSTENIAVRKKVSEAIIRSFPFRPVP